jgi:hypothetical protein
MPESTTLERHSQTIPLDPLISVLPYITSQVVKKLNLYPGGEFTVTNQSGAILHIEDAEVKIKQGGSVTHTGNKLIITNIKESGLELPLK